ncbi:ABC transporter permease [Streptomyces nanshensis]|uniref:ABC transporter permease n=1 Tax=Streptomyces nanshensis TaxID=518642 RepID=A0A1E7LAL4_9ACTN|nr:ABC transporter permease [Streptomyces nanshensis]OEV13190.1 ABC transporter permease [Streptomyces nanshensis]
MTANDWICAEFVRTRGQELTDATLQHVGITLASVALALLIAFPLALAARRWRRAYGPVLGLTTVLYTVPSLAMYALLLPLFGLGAAVVVSGLVLYSLTVLVRNILAGLESVPDEAREAARGMGYGPFRLLFGVELPLALPALMAGVRIATVSAVALTTVGAIVGYGGLGNLIYDGMDSFFRAQVLTASVICVVLAVLADVLLLGLQRLLTPWTRTGGGARARARIRGGGRGGPGAGASGGVRGSGHDDGVPDVPGEPGGVRGVPEPAGKEA